MEENHIIKKICSKCKQEKILDEFVKDSRKADGRGSKCYECKRQQHKERWANLNKQDKKRNYQAVKKYRNTEKGKQHFKKKRFSKWIARFTKIKYFRCYRCEQIKAAKEQYDLPICKYCYQKLIIKVDDSVRKCKECNETYFSFDKHSRKGYCSDACCDKVERKRRKLYRNKSDKKHKTRAKKYGVLYKPVNRLKVFKRDKWKCQSCGIKVQTDNYLHDDAAELDHIVPLSLGGAHTYSNVQTMCRSCNIKKSNNYTGQLGLSL